MRAFQDPHTENIYQMVSEYLSLSRSGRKEERIISTIEKNIKEPSIAAVLPVQIFTMLISITAMFVDNLMIGQYLSNDALAAYGYTTPVTLFITAFGGMIGNGCQVLASESAGVYNDKRFNSIFSTAVASGIVGSALIGIIMVVFPRQLSVLLGAASDETIALTSEYLCGIAFAFPVIVTLLIVPSFMQMRNRRKQLVISAIMLIVLDIAFDFLNVLVFNGGMLGMALASVLSYYISFVYLSLPHGSRMKLSGKVFSGKILKELLRYGLLYLVYKMCQVFLSLLMNHLLTKKGGTEYVAANSIIASVNLVTGSFPSGFGSTATMICSFYIGQKRIDKMKEELRRLIKLSAAVSVCITFLVLMLAPVLIQAFKLETQLTSDIAVFGLRCFSISMVFNMLNYIYKNSCRSLKMFKKAYAVCALNDLLMPAAVALILLVCASVKMLWLSYAAGQSITTIAIFLYYKLKKEQHQA